MTKKTLREQYKETLISKGWSVATKQTSSKYLTMTKESFNHDVYLGRAGAIRWGRIPSKSYSMNDKGKAILLKT